MGKRKVEPGLARQLYIGGASVQDIAKRFGVSRVAIWKAFESVGFKTDGYRVMVLCAVCGKSLARRRKHCLRTTNHYCSTACYIVRIRQIGEQYRPWRHGSRKARCTVSAYIKLLPGMIVHHEDKDSRHNELCNLRVFASQADHMWYHRGGPPCWIWDGRSPGPPLA